MSESDPREHKLGCDEYHRHHAPECCDNACWCLRSATSAPCARHCWQVWDQHHTDARCCQCDTPRGPLDMQGMVREWHSNFGVVIGEYPEIRRPELRASLIEEEGRETCDAIRRGDLVEAIDGMCDILYVVFGTAVEFGIDLAPFFAEVHRTNMLKVGGATREDGKVLKPEDWKPPRIAEMLAAMNSEEAK